MARLRWLPLSSATSYSFLPAFHSNQCTSFFMNMVSSSSVEAPVSAEGTMQPYMFGGSFSALAAFR